MRIMVNIETNENNKKNNKLPQEIDTVLVYEKVRFIINSLWNH